MYKGKRILGVITARGGSKGIPRKNVIDVGGKPLIGWTIDTAKESKLLDRVVLSSDDDEIIRVATALGCEAPFKRSADLSGDAASSADVVIDCLQRIPGYDYVVLLQPTSPLRRVDDIDAAIRMCVDSDAPSCVSVCEAEESPYWMYKVMPDGVMESLLGDNYLRRQDLPPVYVLNGAVYVLRAEWFRCSQRFVSNETVAYPMPRSRSVDVDSLDDLEWVRFEISKKV